MSEINALVGQSGFSSTAARGLSQADLDVLVNFQFTEHAPADITLSNAAVAENQAGAVVGTWRRSMQIPWNLTFIRSWLISRHV